MSKELYDIIRFYSNISKPNVLILSWVTEKQKDEWCNHENTHEGGEWFDGYTRHESRQFDCQNDEPMYPNNYTPDDL